MRNFGGGILVDVSLCLEETEERLDGIDFSGDRLGSVAVTAQVRLEFFDEVGLNVFWRSDGFFVGKINELVDIFAVGENGGIGTAGFSEVGDE